MMLITLTNALRCVLFFLNRNYPARVIDNAIRKVSTIDRATALAPNTSTSNNRIPFTLTYHPPKNYILKAYYYPLLILAGIQIHHF